MLKEVEGVAGRVAALLAERDAALLALHQPQPALQHTQAALARMEGELRSVREAGEEAVAERERVEEELRASRLQCCSLLHHAAARRHLLLALQQALQEEEEEEEAAAAAEEERLARSGVPSARSPGPSLVCARV